MGTYDNAFGGALHDPMFDQEGAVTIKVMDFLVAWTEGGQVLIDTGDDDWTPIGDLEWEDNVDPTKEYEANIKRLREFVESELTEGIIKTEKREMNDPKNVHEALRRITGLVSYIGRHTKSALETEFPPTESDIEEYLRDVLDCTNAAQDLVVWMQNELSKAKEV